MKSFNNFVTENISKKDAERIKQMKTASPEQAKSLQSGLKSRQKADKVISSGKTRISRSGQATRTRPSARIGGGEVDASFAAAARQSGRVRTGTNTPLSELPKADTAPITPEKAAEREKFRSKSPEPSVGRGETKRAAALNQAIKDGANTPSGSPRSRGGEILDKLTNRPESSTAVKQSEVSLKAKDYRAKFRRGTQGPSTKLRTPKQTEKYLTGVKKGYFDPKSGRVSEKGLQKHVSMRAVGGENFGKMKGADPRGELAKVSNIVSRAQGGDRAARSEIRRSYKSITKNYSPETGARTNPATRRSFRTFQQQVSNTNVPKLEPPKKMPIPSAPSTGSSSGPTPQTATKTATRTKTPTLNLGTPPKTTSAPTKGGELALGTKSGQLVAPSKSTYTGIGGGKKVEVAGGSKPSSATTNLLPPGQTQTGKPSKRREVKIPKPLAPKKSQVVKNVETSLSGAKQAYPKDSTAARKLVGLKRGGRLLGRALGPAMTAWDAYDSYKAERERGQTKERATKAAIATAGGGALGAWGGAKAGAAIGGTIGSIVPGAGTAIGAGIGGLVGGIGGYMAGSGAGKALLGASKKDKEWMSMTNRKNQAGTSATATTFKSGNKGIVRDADGKERVGYAAVKDGKTVYKTANDPKSLKYTSSNPLERLGRSTADAGIPFVSDFLKNRYAKGDEAARKRKVAAVKASATNK
tara:strand:- start:2141 stop:4231 length:2091 start_codon:yes stop_codon:yes gene_type:complete